MPGFPVFPVGGIVGDRLDKPVLAGVFLSPLVGLGLAEKDASRREIQRATGMVLRIARWGNITKDGAYILSLVQPSLDDLPLVAYRAKTGGHQNFGAFTLGLNRHQHQGIVHFRKHIDIAILIGEVVGERHQVGGLRVFCTVDKATAPARSHRVGYAVNNHRVVTLLRQYGGAAKNDGQKNQKS